MSRKRISAVFSGRSPSIKDYLQRDDVGVGVIYGYADRVLIVSVFCIVVRSSLKKQTHQPMTAQTPVRSEVGKLYVTKCQF